MNATLLLQAMNIRAPELVGTVRVHRMDKHADEPETPTVEDLRIARLERRVHAMGEKRQSNSKLESREARHWAIIKFISGLSRDESMNTHELAAKLGLYYTSLVNDLATIRKTNKINFSAPSHSGIGRLYWGKT